MAEVSQAAEESISPDIVGRALTARLATVAALSDAESAFLADCAIAPRRLARGEDVFVEGDVQSNIYLCLKGLGARYRILADGQRQIVDFILPGTLFGSDIDEAGKRLISAEALQDIDVAVVDDGILQRIARHQPGLAARFAIALSDENVRLLERVISLGRRDAEQRLGYLLLELNERLTSGDKDLVVKLPVPQQEIADYLGLTSVHVSRTLHKMHDDGLIAIEDSLITIRQPDTLAELAEFDPHQVNVSTIPEPLRRALLDCN
jgi:CRP-like cAMP-binding protein